MTENRIEQLKVVSREMRIDILKMCHSCGKNNAHLGGCLSSVEILSVLFLEIIKMNNNCSNEYRDRFVLSKGHAGIALYAALKQIGVISQKDIQKPLRGVDAELFRHPKRNLEKYIEVSSGSLGQGFPYSVGLALAMKKKSYNDSRVFVIVGDGECNEGSIWEAAAFASHMQLDNLVVIVDKNGLQLDGFTSDILQMDNMEEKWRAFGFEVATVDGHDIEMLYLELLHARERISKKPLAIIANTIKGKGVSFAENVPEWHDGFLSDDLYEVALKEIQNV